MTSPSAKTDLRLSADRYQAMVETHVIPVKAFDESVGVIPLFCNNCETNKPCFKLTPTIRETDCSRCGHSSTSSPDDHIRYVCALKCSYWTIEKRKGDLVYYSGMDECNDCGNAMVGATQYRIARLK
jgi:hypothetical protein